MRRAKIADVKQPCSVSRSHIALNRQNPNLETIAEATGLTIEQVRSPI
ncbi:MAG: hypothetical protein MUC48_17380 [Leptolyngbya sp. Prado105]|nr:hypothetical protein [Leptolyngbya sp. Prado105]